MRKAITSHEYPAAERYVQGSISFAAGRGLILAGQVVQDLIK